MQQATDKPQCLVCYQDFSSLQSWRKHQKTFHPAPGSVGNEQKRRKGTLYKLCTNCGNDVPEVAWHRHLVHCHAEDTSATNGQNSSHDYDCASDAVPPDECEVVVEEVACSDSSDDGVDITDDWESTASSSDACSEDFDIDTEVAEPTQRLNSQSLHIAVNRDSTDVDVSTYLGCDIDEPIFYRDDSPASFFDARTGTECDSDSDSECALRDRLISTIAELMDAVQLEGRRRKLKLLCHLRTLLSIVVSEDGADRDNGLVEAVAYATPASWPTFEKRYLAATAGETMLYAWIFVPKEQSS